MNLSQQVRYFALLYQDRDVLEIYPDGAVDDK